MHERTVDLHCGDNRMFVVDMITNKAEALLSFFDVSQVKFPLTPLEWQSHAMRNNLRLICWVEEIDQKRRLTCLNRIRRKIMSREEHRCRTIRKVC
jgi:hypothetical protein